MIIRQADRLNGYLNRLELVRDVRGYEWAGDAVVIHSGQRGPRRQRRRRHCREAAEPIAANDLHGLVTLRLLACVMDAGCQ